MENYDYSDRNLWKKLKQTGSFRTHRSPDLFNFYLKKNPGTDISQVKFRNVLKDYNEAIIDRLLLGDEIQLFNGMGSIIIKKHPRSFSRKKVDFGTTNALKKQGINKIVYFTDDYFCMIHWVKKTIKVKNISVYKFVPSGGENGFKKKLFRHLRNDDSAYLNFRS